MKYNIKIEQTGTDHSIIRIQHSRSVVLLNMRAMSALLHLRLICRGYDSHTCTAA